MPQAAHPLVIRITHWLNAFSVIVMILSGWRIYNASPLFGFIFPDDFTLGGWLAGAIAWHLAAMWLLMANGLVYLGYGLASGQFRRRFLRGEGYTAGQRALYAAAILLMIVAALSGLAIWKPVQLQEMTALFGGFELARRVHFFAMAGLAAFLVAHVAAAFATKGALKAMISGGSTP